MSSTANAASVGQIRSGLRALGESLRRGRRKVCPVLGLIEIETASKSLFSLSVQNVSVCAKSNVGTLVFGCICLRNRDHGVACAGNSMVPHAAYHYCQHSDRDSSRSIAIEVKRKTVAT